MPHCCSAFNVMLLLRNQMLTWISFPYKYLALFCLGAYFFFIFTNWWFYSYKSWNWPFCSIFPSIWGTYTFRSSFILRRSPRNYRFKDYFCFDILLIFSIILSSLYFTLFFISLEFSWFFWRLSSPILIVFLALPILLCVSWNSFSYWVDCIFYFNFFFLCSNSISHLSSTYSLLLWGFEFLMLFNLQLYLNLARICIIISLLFFKAFLKGLHQKKF